MKRKRYIPKYHCQSSSHNCSSPNKAIFITSLAKFINSINTNRLPPNCLEFLSFLSKVLEKFSQDQIMSYLNGSNLLDRCQTGFRKYSTQSVLKLTNDIQVGKDKKFAIPLLLFDFIKAFDTISPSKLLSKRWNPGFSRSALQWFWSYLWARSQWVFSLNHLHQL